MLEIDPAHVRAVLEYEPDTGLFRWRARPRVKAGKIAGNVNANGYLRIGLGGIDGATYMAHRLAWAYMTGAWPVEDIDHINGMRTDNRWANLRAVSRAVNLQNQRGPRSNNKTGYLGVRRAKGKFVAAIGVNGHPRHVGTFDSPEAAHAAYLAAKRVLHEGNTL